MEGLGDPILPVSKIRDRATLSKEGRDRVIVALTFKVEAEVKVSVMLTFAETVTAYSYVLPA